jgi:hypothetical protein
MFCKCKASGAAEPCTSEWEVRISQTQDPGRKYWVRINDGHRQWDPPKSPNPKLSFLVVLLPWFAWFCLAAVKLTLREPHAIWTVFGCCAAGLVRVCGHPTAWTISFTRPSIRSSIRKIDCWPQLVLLGAWAAMNAPVAAGIYPPHRAKIVSRELIIARLASDV